MSPLGAAPGPGQLLPCLWEWRAMMGGCGALRRPWGQALEPPGLSHAPFMPQVYHLLFGPSPALEVGSGLPRGQDPWRRLGSNPLFRMEVRGSVSGMGACRLPLAGVSASVGEERGPCENSELFLGVRGVPGSLWLAAWGRGRQDSDVLPAPSQPLGCLGPGTVRGRPVASVG